MTTAYDKLSRRFGSRPGSTPGGRSPGIPADYPGMDRAASAALHDKEWSIRDAAERSRMELVDGIFDRFEANTDARQERHPAEYRPLDDATKARIMAVAVEFSAEAHERIGTIQPRSQEEKDELVARYAAYQPGQPHYFDPFGDPPGYYLRWGFRIETKQAQIDQLILLQEGWTAIDLGGLSI